MKLLLIFAMLLTAAVARAQSEFPLDTALASTAIVDVATTQHCIQVGTCREGNPLLPSNTAGMYAVAMGLTAAPILGGHWLHKRKSKAWWVPAAVGIAVHSAAIGWYVDHAVAR